MYDTFSNNVKLLKAVNLLASPRGATIKGLSQELGVSRRSVFRLIAFLEQMGFPLIDDQPVPRAVKTYRLLESYVIKLPNIVIPSLCFSEKEMHLLIALLDNDIACQQTMPAAMIKIIKKKLSCMTIRDN